MRFRKFMLISLILLSSVMISACTPQKAGVDLLVTGKSFSLSEVLVDGKSAFSDMNKNNSAGEHLPVEEIISFPVNRGSHRIVLLGKDGRKVEIEATIKAKENYASYDSHAGVLQWNDGEYPVFPGQAVVVK
ncbi:MAG: hypothetical protein HZA14_00515 [Nitrospirae bacterium]|nr:hypothetical protein [Nitrospirota bacterium]